MKSEVRKFLFTCPLALVTLFIPALFDNQLQILCMILVVSVMMLLVDLNKKYLELFILVMISGPLAESIAINFGLWNYSNPFFLGTPIWLPLVWGNAGLYIVRLKALIDEIKA